MATTDNSNGKNQWDEKELGCLWRRETQKTKEKYLTGVLKRDKLMKLLAASNEDVQVVCFSNKKKEKDTHPDFRIYLSEKRPAADAKAPAAKAATATKAAPAPVPDANDLI